jgi:hypothetical protein
MNTNVNCHVHKSPTPVPILSQMNSVQALLHCSFKIRLNIILPAVPRLSECCPPSRRSNKNFSHIFHLPMRVTLPAHLILLDWIILNIFDKK